MFDYHLFLGFPINLDLNQKLQSIPEVLRSLYLQGNEYLQIIEIEGSCFAGKVLGQSVDSSSLDLIQEHIFSILKLLFPAYAFEKHDLLLLAVPALGL